MLLSNCTYRYPHSHSPSAVSESILEERVVLAKAEEGTEEVRGLSEAQAALTQPDQVLAVERTVVMWLKQIGKCS